MQVALTIRLSEMSQDPSLHPPHRITKWLMLRSFIKDTVLTCTIRMDTMYMDMIHMTAGMCIITTITTMTMQIGWKRVKNLIGQKESIFHVGDKSLRML
jgi:hypothetical protein